MPIISPSLLAANFGALNESIKTIENAGADWLHLDVMDGAFVPNISFGPCVISSIRKHTNLFFDVHLMVNEPIRYIEDYVNAGADAITVHLEACSDVAATLKKIKSYKVQNSSGQNVKVGISIKPNTHVQSLTDYLHLCDMVLIMTVEPGFGGQKIILQTIDKIGQTKALCKKVLTEQKDLPLVQADGGITLENLPLLLAQGLDVVVMGSAIFNSPLPSDIINKIKNMS